MVGKDKNGGCRKERKGDYRENTDSLQYDEIIIHEKDIDLRIVGGEESGGYMWREI